MQLNLRMLICLQLIKKIELVHYFTVYQKCSKVYSFATHLRMLIHCFAALSELGYCFAVYQRSLKVYCFAIQLKNIDLLFCNFILIDSLFCSLPMKFEGLLICNLTWECWFVVLQIIKEIELIYCFTVYQRSLKVCYFATQPENVDLQLITRLNWFIAFQLPKKFEGLLLCNLPKKFFIGIFLFTK